jgi:hypothetical protein
LVTGAFLARFFALPEAVLALRLTPEAAPVLPVVAGDIILDILGVRCAGVEVFSAVKDVDTAKLGDSVALLTEKYGQEIVFAAH